MPKKNKKKIVCKEYVGEVCEPKGKRIVCRKKKLKVCREK